MSMLEVKDVVVRYGGVEALKGVSLEANEGAVTTLIGSNGAGKTTCLRAITGLTPINAGEIWFAGKRIDGIQTERIVMLGIGCVPEGRRLFLDMSVNDNLLTGAYLRQDRDGIQRDMDRVYEYFPSLARARNRLASSLSGGEQQMLAIGRTLMVKPRFLVLDEPSLGLSPILTEQVGSIIRKIADEGLSILLVEQNASLALDLAKTAYVLETGRVVMEGNAQDLQKNEHVRKAYLGL